MFFHIPRILDAMHLRPCKAALKFLRREALAHGGFPGFFFFREVFDGMDGGKTDIYGGLT